jgi:hypothetical protein
VRATASRIRDYLRLRRVPAVGEPVPTTDDGK